MGFHYRAVPSSALAFGCRLPNHIAIRGVCGCHLRCPTGGSLGQILLGGRIFWHRCTFQSNCAVELSRRMFLWLDFTCLAMFLVSLALLKTRTRLSIASITDPTPQSESL